MYTILAIDDQEEFLAIIKETTEKLIPNCKVLTSLSGEEGVVLAQNEQPDTIVLDIIMPEMDGYEVCKKLKKDNRTKHIPILMITASKTVAESRIKALNLGADAFLSKPIDHSELKSQLKVMLRIKKAEDKIRYENELLEEKIKERTKELSKSEERFRKLIQFAPNAFFQGDSQGNFITVNKHACKLTGFTEEELLLMNMKDIFSEAELKEKALMYKQLQQGKTIKRERKLTQKNGDEIYVEMYSKVMGDGTYQSFMTDITERKQSGGRIKKLSTAINQSPVIIAITDLNGITEYVNPKFSKSTGYTAKEAIGKNHRILKSGAQADEIYKKLWETISSGNEWRGEFHNKKKNGELFWESATISPIFDTQGKIINYLKVAEDITDQKLQEDKILQQKLRLSNIIEGANVGTWDWNIQTGELMLNEHWAEIMGYTLKELEPIDVSVWEKNTHPDDLAIANNLLNKLFNKELDYYDVEFRQPHKNGDWIWVNARGKITEWSDDGKPLRMSGTHVDITARKRVEEALISSEDRLKIIFDSAPDAIYLSDLKGIFIDGNIAAENIIGHKKADLIGKSFLNLKFLSTKELLKAAKMLAKNILGKKTGPDEFLLNRDDGSQIHVEISTYPIKIQNKTLVLGIARDISGRKLTEKKIAESEMRFKALHNASFGGIAIHDVGIIKDCNQGLSDISRYTFEELVGLDGLLLIAEHSREEVMKNIKSSYEKPYEVIGIRKNGDEYPLRLEARNIPYEGKEMRVVEFRDISESKQTEKALRESDEKLRSIFKNSTAIFYSHNVDNVLNYISPQIKNILGYTEEEAIHKWGHFASDNPINKIGFANSIKAIETGKQQAPYEMELVKKSGETIWVEVREFPLMEKGKAVGISGSFFDITERKRAEQVQRTLYNISNAVSITDTIKDLLQIIQKELGTIIDTKNFYIAFYDAKSNTISAPFMSDEKDSFKTFPAGKTLTYYVIKTQKSLLATKEKLQELEDSGEVEGFGTNSEIWLGIPLKVDDKVIGVFAVQSYTDENAYNENDVEMLEFIADRISQSIYRKNTEKSLILALEKAEESDRLKSAFLANMSHEIRTPMNGILGFANLLEESKLISEEQVDYVNIINRSGNRMLNLINNIIDISKIEAGQMKVVLSEFDIYEQLDFLHSFFAPEASKKGLNFVYENKHVQDKLIIKSDKEKFNAILTNLIKNAIKYTHEGSIKYGIQIKKSPDQAKLEFFVKDSGIGIPKNRQKAVFERFIQADIEDKKALEGAGLGLAISKAYAKILGGEISLESEENKGSLFYFSIPYTEKNAEAKLEIDTPKTETVFGSKNLNILIAEDDKTSEFYLKSILKGISKNILSAETGIEAITLCKKNPDLDLIFMDIKMPKLDGFEAAKQIRKFNKKVIIIAQTAYALEGDREKAIAAGCNDYISKPIKKSLLLNLVRKHLTK